MLKKMAPLTMALGLTLALPTQAALFDRGNGLIYDNVLNVTWTSDANLFKTMASIDGSLVSRIIASVPTVIDTPNVYDTPAYSGYYNVRASDFSVAAGSLNWFGAKAWVGYLNHINYRGYNDWSLPTTAVFCVSYSCANSQLGELFYNELGGVVFQPITTTHNTNYGLFKNLQSPSYWSGTEWASNPSNVFSFGAADGSQNLGSKPYGSSGYSAWAVRSGDVAAVPEPEMWALLLAGVGLVGFASRRRKV